MKSTDGFLAGGRGVRNGLQKDKRMSWFSFQQMGGASADLVPQHRLSSEIHIDGQHCCPALYSSASQPLRMWLLDDILAAVPSCSRLPDTHNVENLADAT